MAHGLKYENEALRKYQEKYGVNVQDCGIFVSKMVPFIGASPDGIVNHDVVCEVKRVHFLLRTSQFLQNLFPIYI